MSSNPVNVGTRIASMLLDHLFMIILIVLPIIPFQFASDNGSSSNNVGFSYAIIGGMAIYLCKDCIGGRSLAKRILKNQVVNAKTNIPAPPLSCLVRNLLIIIWPVEVIAVLVNPQRRLGDKLAGTKVEVYNPSSGVVKTNILQIIISLIIALAFLYIVYKLMGLAMGVDFI